jgi:hypothetical protein
MKEITIKVQVDNGETPDPDNLAFAIFQMLTEDGYEVSVSVEEA